MEFNKRLQELRKSRRLTQEELAEALFVTRTAVSKWESGRGYPNIDSLKSIAKFFSVSIDELISGEDVVSIAENDRKVRERKLANLVFSVLDLSVVLFFFLPVFSQRTTNMVEAASLIGLKSISGYLKALYFSTVLLILMSGIFILIYKNEKPLPIRLSLTFNVVSVLLFSISLQPYASLLAFISLIIKALLLWKTKMIR